MHRVVTEKPRNLVLPVVNTFIRSTLIPPKTYERTYITDLSCVGPSLRIDVSITMMDLEYNIVKK